MNTTLAPVSMNSPHTIGYTPYLSTTWAQMYVFVSWVHVVHLCSQRGRQNLCASLQTETQ